MCAWGMGAPHICAETVNVSQDCIRMTGMYSYSTYLS